MYSMVIEDLLDFPDAYMTLADNFYIYSESKTKRMIYIPTGLDITTGASIFLKSYMIDGNYSSQAVIRKPRVEHF